MGCSRLVCAVDVDWEVLMASLKSASSASASGKADELCVTADCEVSSCCASLVSVVSLDIVFLRLATSDLVL